MTRVFDEDLVAGFGTRAIHAGQRPEPLAGAIMTPVYLTSTYVQEGLGLNRGYEYARGKNPTREAFERNVAALENGKHGFAFASGLGALDSIMKLFRAGDHIVCGENVYGGTFRLFDKILQHMGLSFSYVDTRDPQRIEDAITPATRAVLVETPTNPLMRLTDIKAAAGEVGFASAESAAPVSSPLLLCRAPPGPPDRPAPVVPAGWEAACLPLLGCPVTGSIRRLSRMTGPVPGSSGAVIRRRRLRLRPRSRRQRRPRPVRYLLSWRPQRTPGARPGPRRKSRCPSSG